MQPRPGQAGPLRSYGSLLLLGDANCMMCMRAIRTGNEDRAYLSGTGAPMLAGWLTGTALGAGAVSVLPAPQALGFDLMLPAFAAAMMAAMAQDRADLLPVAVGAVGALTWAIGSDVAAALLGVVVVALLRWLGL